MVDEAEEPINKVNDSKLCGHITGTVLTEPDLWPVTAEGIGRPPCTYRSESWIGTINERKMMKLRPLRWIQITATGKRLPLQWQVGQLMTKNDSKPSWEIIF